MPKPTRTPLACSAPASWAWGASRRLGGEVSSQHLRPTWSRRELRASRESGWPRWGRGAPRSRAKGAGRPFWQFGAATATSLGRIATPRGTCRSGAPRRGTWNLGIDSGLVKAVFIRIRAQSCIDRPPSPPPSWCAPRRSAPATPPSQLEGADATRGPGRPKRLVVVAQGHRGRPAAGSRRRTPSYKFTSTTLLADYIHTLHTHSRT